jgi:hypothetical protein
MFRDWHRRFGTRFTLNCYYRTADGFTLAQFPDRYRAEWADQADWLRLSFHAEADSPAYPYRDDVRGEACARDFDRVRHEILRFAGDAAWAPPSIVHFVAIPRSAWPVLIARGVTALGGFFGTRAPDDLNFHLSAAAQEEILHKGTWRDPETGLTLFHVPIVCNNTPPDRTGAVLEAWTQRCPAARVVPIWTHEQYFWDFYENHLPDHPQRVENALRWAADRALKPVFLHDYPWEEAD